MSTVRHGRVSSSVMQMLIYAIVTITAAPAAPQPLYKQVTFAAAPVIQPPPAQQTAEAQTVTAQQAMTFGPGPYARMCPNMQYEQQPFQGGWFDRGPMEDLLPGWLSQWHLARGTLAFYRVGRSGHIEESSCHPVILAVVDSDTDLHNAFPELRSTSYPLVEGRWHAEAQRLVQIESLIRSNHHLAQWAYQMGVVSWRSPGPSRPHLRRGYTRRAMLAAERSRHATTPYRQSHHSMG